MNEFFFVDHDSQLMRACVLSGKAHGHSAWIPVYVCLYSRVVPCILVDFVMNSKKYKLNNFCNCRYRVFLRFFHCDRQTSQLPSVTRFEK